VEFAFAHPELSMPYTRQHAQNMDENIIRQHITMYVNNFSVDLGEEGKRAVRLLLDTANYKNLIPAIIEPLLV
jgi:1,4-dihydroxy-6-naphthoate synthase